MLKRLMMTTLATLGVAFAPLAAQADTGLSIGPVLGTTGAGGSITWAIPESPYALHVSTGNLTVNPTINANGNQYKGNLNLSNILADLEVHPNGHAFFVSVGAFMNNNTIHATTTSNGVVIGNTNYGAGTATATVTWNHTVPYFGFGLARMHGGLGVDLGMAFQGPATARVSTNIAGVSAADITNAQNQIQNAVNGFQIYPVINVRYQFSL